MKRYLAELKPQERRWLVGIVIVVFLMLNYFFVWPHFHDWGSSDALMARMTKTNDVYNAELRHKDTYTRLLIELQSDGSMVVPEDQAIDFVHFYNSRAISNKIIVVNQGPLVTHTNEFFIEQQMGVTVQADETNLVKFLYSLAAGNSMMRVRAMSLHPDQSHMQLSANVTLVASYQKKAPTRGAGAAAPVRPVAEAPKPTPAPPPPVVVKAQPPASPVISPAVGQHEHTNRIAGAFARLTGTNKTASLNPNRP
jgi:hypothetical protein